MEFELLILLWWQDLKLTGMSGMSLLCSKFYLYNLFSIWTTLFEVGNKEF